jgi:hypothetical protein
MYPESTAQTKKEWTTPKIRKVDLRAAPYAELIEILRSTLQQAEKTVSLNPKDLKAVEMQRSLQRMLDDLESKHRRNAA